MIHAFESTIAEEYGVLEALIFNYIAFWVQKNEANRKHFHDGKWWTYNSATAFNKQFPYATPKKIRTAIDHLKEAGLIVAGDYNEDARDRTLWYALTEKGKCILPTGQMQAPQGADASAPQGTPLPVNNTVNNTEKKNSKKKPDEDAFVPPTVEEVRAYCEERNNGIDPEMFINHYTANGWMVGKTKMKNWKASMRTWELRRKEEAQPKHFNGERQYGDEFFKKLEERDK